MADGFILDHAESGSRKPSQWVEGAPQKSIWMGLKLQGKRRLDIRTSRCARCGYLENYAPA